MNAMTEAKEWAKENSMPVIVHANCVRIHSHSNSDRHELYRDENERNYVKNYDPVAKYKRMLIRYERFTEKELAKFDEEAKKIVKEAHKKGLAAPDPKPESIYDYVTPEPYKASKYPEGIHTDSGSKKK